MMHVLYVVAVFTAVLHCTTNVEAFGEECFTELGLTEEDIKAATVPIWKLRYCYLEKDGTIVDGKFSYDSALARIMKTIKDPKMQEISKTVLDLCRSELESTNATGEQLAMEIVACSEKHKPKQ